MKYGLCQKYQKLNVRDAQMIAYHPTNNNRSRYKLVWVNV